MRTCCHPHPLPPGCHPAAAMAGGTPLPCHVPAVSEGILLHHSVPTMAEGTPLHCHGRGDPTLLLTGWPGACPGS